jgi:hypothetical protein
MEPMQSSFGCTFSGIFPLGTLAGLEGMLSSHTEPVFLQNQVVFTCSKKLCTRAKTVPNYLLVTAFVNYLLKFKLK